MLSFVGGRTLLVQGMARFGHLADGRLKLVLVRRCNALQYLNFLLSMSRTGECDRPAGRIWLRQGWRGGM
jgi:hypothetical protein